MLSRNVVRFSAILLSLGALGLLALSVAIVPRVSASAQVTSQLLAVAPAAPAASAASQQAEQRALQAFMRQKLEASNKILEGLCLDELALVESGADTLLQMSREEKWRASNDMLYRRYSTEFVDAVTDMKEKAKAKSLDGTSLAWINATMKCFKCHEWVRNTIVADGHRDALPRKGTINP